jgi:hypothetical protein
MSSNPCLNSFYRLGDPVMDWGVDFRGLAVFSSVRASRTVREDLADGPRRVCSSRVLRVLARLCFRFVVLLCFGWAKFRTARVYRADSPRVPGGQSAAPRGQSVFRGSLLEVLLAFTDSPRPKLDDLPYPCGQSPRPCRTVRVARADSPPLLAGRSARAWLLCSLVRFLLRFFRASACASRSRS